MYKRILVPVDGSEPAARGLEEAIKIATATQGELRLINIVNELVLTSPQAPLFNFDKVLESLRAGGQAVLDTSKAKVEKAKVRVTTELVESMGGRAADFIVDQAKSWSAELIVMGTHGRRGLVRLAMGSDAELVLRYAPCPVLMVRGER